MPKMLDRIRMVQRGELPPPPVATLIKVGHTVGLVECDVHDDKDRLVARASSTCMTLRGAQAEGR